MLLIVVTLSLGSCEATDVGSFDTATSYIYIDTPFLYDSYGRLTKERLKEYVYSFAFDDYEVKDYTFKVPVSIMGKPFDVDRQYKVEVVRDKTTATAEDWDENSISEVYIKKGEVVTPLEVVVKRHDRLKDVELAIVLRVLENENFAVGDKDLMEITLKFSDILKEPSWWKYYVKYFGPYQKEIYIQWREIYYLGVDPGINFGNGEQLYWDNMPTSFYADWYPILDMCMKVMKQYFIDNEVYPDGDTSKPRILLPN